MDLAAIILFLFLYYIRPQEWIGWAASLELVRVSIAFAIITMFSRHRGLTWKDFFKTPHDWLMLAYFLWIVGTSAASFDTLGNVYNNFVIYAITVQALSSMQRVTRFLNWWTVMIFVIAALGVASEYGFDPMEGYDKTHGQMRGRLILNTSIFWNPNAFGHSVVPVLAMLYFILCWRRPIFMKIATVPVLFLPFYCIYMTASKGAFLAGFASAVTALTFGRPKVFQVLILCGAMTMGVTALYTLPRMGELDKSANDGAIQGRKAAFTYGLTILKNDWNGVGYKKFIRSFTKAHTFSKAAHSSYVNIGAELGYAGFFLYIGLMYSCLRTLLTVKTRDTTEERARRMMFTMLVAYMVSSWMVDFAYRGSFFLLVAAIAAFHRQMLPTIESPKPQVETSEVEVFSPAPAAGLLPFSSGGQSPLPVFAQTTVIVPAPLDAKGRIPEPVEVADAAKPPGLLWQRLSWVDFALITVMTYGFVRFWAYIIKQV